MRAVTHALTCPHCGGALTHPQQVEQRPSRAVDTLTCTHRLCRRTWAYVRQLALIERNNGCGTDNGYQQHRRNGTSPCDPCRDAHAANHRQWRATRHAHT